MKKETKLCLFCGETIKKIAIKCKHCGSMLNQPSPEAPVTSPPSDPVTWIRNALANRYEILEEIGRGGMAVVYKAIQKNLNRPVALKVLPQPFTHDPEFLERFHREAAAAAQLNHPNIVTIYDEGVENEVHFIAMEYVDGDNLHHLIRQQGALSPEATKRLLIPIAEALGYAHEQGMIHRDIKSSNILIDRKSRPVLTDFGIARAAESSQLTRTGTVLGTPEYMSPEQAKGEATDARSDIYSLGVVLYECLTGRLPFQSSSMLGTIHQITHDPLTPLRQVKTDISEGLENAVLRCLAKKPDERYPNCTELITALEHGETRPVSEAKPVAEPAAQPVRPKATTSAPKPGMPLWWKAAVGLISVVLIVVIGVVLTKLIAPPKQPPPDPKSLMLTDLLTQARSYLVTMKQDSLDMSGTKALDTLERIFSLDAGNREAMALKTELATIYRNWGEAALGSGHCEKAVSHFERALEVQPSLPGLGERLAAVKQQLAEQRAREEAERLAEQQRREQEAQRGREEAAHRAEQQRREAEEQSRLAEKIKREKQQRRKQFLENLGIELVFIKGGTFDMGDTFDEGDEDEKPVHFVTVSDFYMSKTEVTVAQYRAYCNAINRSMPDEPDWGWQDDHPIVNVSWHDAVAFCQWASGRLPTEAEWEYAARERGKRVLFGNGKNTADPREINFDPSPNYSYSLAGIYRQQTTPVASFAPNALGLYDMSGNVWEWCNDWYETDYYSKSSLENPTGPALGVRRLVRGGGWSNYAKGVRCMNRLAYLPDIINGNLGIRFCIDSN